MARIRTIKPEFWTDEKIVQLPFEARLTFVGLWNFADDDGRIREEPERLKMQIMPADDVDMELILDVLVAAGLVERFYGEDGESVLLIPGFARHQVISHRAKSKIALESYKKAVIPAASRRAVARKYGCDPGTEGHPAACYFCGAPGSISWFKLRSGRPGAWVAFSGLEIDHHTPEHSGGTADPKNLVLSCRYCNRSRGTNDAFEHISGALQNPPSGMEGKGKEGNRRDLHSGGGGAPSPVRAHEEPPPEATFARNPSPPPAQIQPQPIRRPPPAEPPPPKPAEPAAPVVRECDTAAGFDRIAHRCREVLPSNWGLAIEADARPVVQLVREGLDLETEIVPVLREIACRRTPIRTWPLLANAVAERVLAQRAGRQAQGLSATPAAPPKPEEMIDLGAPYGAWAEPVLRKFVEAHRSRPGTWQEHLHGPPPGQPGCRVPPRLLIAQAA